MAVITPDKLPQVLRILIGDLKSAFNIGKIFLSVQAIKIGLSLTYKNRGYQGIMLVLALIPIKEI